MRTAASCSECPKKAIALGAVDQILPLDDIAEALKTLVERKARV